MCAEVRSGPLSKGRGGQKPVNVVCQPEVQLSVSIATRVILSDFQFGSNRNFFFPPFNQLWEIVIGITEYNVAFIGRHT